jgi:cation diffusion facilitator CzcD-associated flavoprotein CzcO
MTTVDHVDAVAQRALRHLGADPGNWVQPSPGIDHDVVVIGAGQTGLAIAFALRRAGIANVAVLERADEANTGGWLTRARMVTLRTPKTRLGPELGVPELSFQAWYEGLHDEGAWEAIGRIARVDWAAYLAWYQRQIGVRPRYRTRVVDVEPVDGYFRVHLEADGDSVVETARKVVFANGVEGTGGPSLPPVFDGLPAEVHGHTADALDFAALAGKSVGILGAATSALDAAATALEAGATEVHLFSHRSRLVIQPTAGFAPNPAAQDNFHLQADDVRWNARYAQYAAGSSSPLDSVLRVANLPGFHLHLDAGWTAARADGGHIVVDAQDGRHIFDFVVGGTGYEYDPATRPELARVAGDIALWRDKYSPPADKVAESLGLFPYVGAGYEFVEKNRGTAPWLKDIHIFNAAASLSFGRPVGDIPSLHGGVPRLVQRIVRDLYLADLARPRSPATTPEPEDHVDTYAHVIWLAPSLAHQ